MHLAEVEGCYDVSIKIPWVHWLKDVEGHLWKVQLKNDIDTLGSSWTPVWSGGHYLEPNHASLAEEICNIFKRIVYGSDPVGCTGSWLAHTVHIHLSRTRLMVSPEYDVEPRMSQVRTSESETPGEVRKKTGSRRWQISRANLRSLTGLKQVEIWGPCLSARLKTQ